MAKKKQSKRKPKQRPLNAYCVYCKAGTEPSYENYEELMGFMTERARIMGSVRSGVCSKHQKQLTLAIKRARHLGLLPFSSSI